MTSPKKGLIFLISLMYLMVKYRNVNAVLDGAVSSTGPRDSFLKLPDLHFNCGLEPHSTTLTVLILIKFFTGTFFYGRTEKFLRSKLGSSGTIYAVNHCCRGYCDSCAVIERWI